MHRHCCLRFYSIAKRICNGHPHQPSGIQKGLPDAHPSSMVGPIWYEDFLQH